MIDWTKGFSASYHAALVDPATWRDVGRIEIISGSVTRNDESLRQSADVTCRDFDASKERWIRIYLDAAQNENGERQALFTGLATSPEESINGTITEHPLQCYSVLKPAEDILLMRGWYAPAEINGADLIRQLLAVCPCPVVAEPGAPSLSEAIVAEDGESNLSMVGKILDAIDWRLRILGNGTVHICPPPSQPVKILNVNRGDTIEPKITVTNDWFECPNVFRAVSEELSAVARDDSPDSPLSTVNRGREVWMEETSCDLSDSETIADYALRRLNEEQRRYMTASYSRRFDPDILPSDLVLLHYPRQKVDGLFRVTSQTISLTHGAATSEEVSYAG